MQDHESGEAAPSLLRGAPRVLASLGLLLVALGMSVPVYGGWLSGGVEDAYRFGLPVLWGAGALAVGTSARLNKFQPLLLSLFGVSFGFALAHVVGSQPLGWFGLSPSTPQGAAVAKIISEVVPVCAGIFLGAFLARVTLQTLALRGGRVRLSLGFGLLSSIPLVALFVIDPSGGSEAVLALPTSTLFAWLPWIVAFSVANGFMEELWFRGSWFASFKQLLGVGSRDACHERGVLPHARDRVLARPHASPDSRARLALYGLRVRRHRTQDRIVMGASARACDR